MEFGVPKRREFTASKEKYENIAVVTVSEFKGKGTGRTITFNKLGVESLGLDFEKEAQVSFSFDKFRGSVIVANTTGMKNVSEVKVAKTSKSVSDKAYFEAIKENFGIKMEDAVELKMVYSGEDFNGFKTFELQKLEATDVITATVEEAKAETEVEKINVVDEELLPASVNEELTEEAPIEHIQEQASEKEFMESLEAEVAETKAEEVVENPFQDPQAEAVTETVSETATQAETANDENPFLSLGDL